MFWLYENWTNTFVKVHRGDCPHCRDGAGSHAAGRRTPSGAWHGAYLTLEAALLEARAYADRHPNGPVWTVDVCHHCLAEELVRVDR